MAVGAADNGLPGSQLYRLKDGDHIFIDQYEIAVTIADGDAPPQIAPHPHESLVRESDDIVTAAFRELLDTQSTADAGYAMGNSIGGLIFSLGTKFAPNIPALIEIYFEMHPSLAGPRREWVATGNDNLIFRTHPYLAFGWQIAWAISRAPAPEIAAQFSLFAASIKGERRAALDDLQEDVSKYADVESYPEFAGGSGPAALIPSGWGDRQSAWQTRAAGTPQQYREAFDIWHSITAPDNEQHASTTDFNVIEAKVNDGVVYPVWFGTNRAPRTDGPGFTNARSSTITHGQVRVYIPEAHRFGETGQPFWKRLLRLDLRDDRLRVQAIEARDRDHFFAEIDHTMELVREGGAPPCALLFIHGYNVTFEEAAIRAAQIGYDLRVEGATTFFSWPSWGNVGGYAADAATIEASEPLMTEFLVDFARNCGAEKVHVVAHSMGNRGLLRGLQRMAADAALSGGVQLGQIVLAAPDVDRDLFLGLAHLYPRFGERATLYASNSDLPVHVSTKLHGAPRAGYFLPYTVTPYADTIAVPDFDVDLLGHGYFAQAEALLHDIYDLVRNATPPARRQRIELLEYEELKLWRLRR